MEINFDAVKPFLMGIMLIATFCYGLMSALRRVKTLDENPTFAAWLPLLPTFVGTLLGVALPFLFPPTTTSSARGFIGALSGMFMGVIFATLRRQIRLYVKKFAGANAATLLAPIDETGNTLPADGSFMSPKGVAQKKAEAEAEAVKAKSVPARSQREPTGGVIEKKETDFE